MLIVLFQNELSMSKEMCAATLQRRRVKQGGSSMHRPLRGQIHGHPRPHWQETDVDIHAR